MIIITFLLTFFRFQRRAECSTRRILGGITGNPNNYETTNFYKTTEWNFKCACVHVDACELQSNQAFSSNVDVLLRW